MSVLAPSILLDAGGLLTAQEFNVFVRTRSSIRGRIP